MYLHTSYNRKAVGVADVADRQASFAWNCTNRLHGTLRRGVHMRINLSRLAVIGRPKEVLYRLRFNGMWTPFMLAVPHH
jgi:hypothetical protein